MYAMFRACQFVRRRLCAFVLVAGVLACAHSAPIDLPPDQNQLKCFGLHLALSAVQARMAYIDRAPTFVELRPERSTSPLRRGLVVRSSPRSETQFGPSAVWHPIEHEGIALDWGTGFAGFTVALARSGPGYAGIARTYADIEGVPVESFAASLEPVACAQDAAEPRVAADRAAPGPSWDHVPRMRPLCVRRRGAWREDRISQSPRDEPRIQPVQQTNAAPFRSHAGERRDVAGCARGSSRPWYARRRPWRSLLNGRSLAGSG